LVWDQDDNAAVNLLARWREQCSGEKNAGDARNEQNSNETKEVVESRWVKAKRLREEKMARMRTAREADATLAE
jgi:hypothetical protein